MQQHNVKIMISGGGTGGHVFPAIAIADAIKQRIPGTRFLFVGARGKMEMEKVPEAGYQIVGLNVAGLQRRITWKNLLFPYKLMVSLRKAKKTIKQFKPTLVIGVGGYASGPVLRVATRMKIPTIIQEQNSFPGLTNRLLAKRVDRICVAYNGMDKYFPADKIFLTGNPVRQQVINKETNPHDARKAFGLQPNKKTILVTGGSLGARSINQGVCNALKELKENNIQLIWQTGKQFHTTAQTAVDREGISKEIWTGAFISRMDLAYAAADLVVSRAGAIAISEIQAVSKPAILVPSPNVAEDHQTKNAQALVNYNAAVLLEDHKAPESLKNQMINTITNQQLLEKLNKNVTALAKNDAANTIAGVVVDMIKM